ncbi:MAG: stage III sporulation protein AC [Clostridiaceae bacterium]|jgi:stage III sporulation protein AC|nr:stage III sporulation protein AC [Clostridiaceae bacterium]
MDIAFLLKIAGIGLIVAVLNSVLSKSGREEYAMLTVIAGVAVILFMLVPQISELISTVRSSFDL